MNTFDILFNLGFLRTVFYNVANKSKLLAVLAESMGRFRAFKKYKNYNVLDFSKNMLFLRGNMGRA